MCSRCNNNKRSMMKYMRDWTRVSIRLAFPWTFKRIEYSLLRIQVVQLQLRSGRLKKRHHMLHIGLLIKFQTSKNELILKGKLTASIITFPISQPLQREINWLSSILVLDVMWQNPWPKTEIANMKTEPITKNEIASMKMTKVNVTTWKKGVTKKLKSHS